MGVRILLDGGQAVLYCSTTDWAFGPIMSDDDDHDAIDRMQAFLEWLPKDARTYSDSELESKYTDWRAQEKEQWVAKEKAERKKHEELDN